MGPNAYRDMHLLNEVTHSPHASQRELSRRIGVALGLTNLMLRRLAKKGYIKVTGTTRSRIRYLVTPQGILEKSRLTYEFIEYSLYFYGQVRRVLREQLLILSQADHRRILLCGTGELAEIAFLTIQEMGLELVGVVDGAPERDRFLGCPVRELAEAAAMEYDRIVIATHRSPDAVIRRLAALGVAPERMISLPRPGVPASAAGGAVGAVAVPAAWAPRLTEAGSGAERTARTPVDPGGEAAGTEVVVLCGGRGIRLGPLTSQTPKPLLPVAGRPFLLHLLLKLQREGFSRFLLAAHYRAEQFQAFLRTYEALVPNLQLITEPQPQGTGGALRHAADAVRSTTFVAVNGDTWVSQSLAPVLAHHRQAQQEYTVVAVQAARVEGGALKKGVWGVGAEGEVVDFTTQASVSEGWVNAGAYVLDRAFVRSWPKGRYSLEANLPILLQHRKAGVFCSEGRLLDIGTPECYELANRFFESAEAGTAIPAATAVGR